VQLIRWTQAASGAAGRAKRCAFPGIYIRSVKLFVLNSTAACTFGLSASRLPEDGGNIRVAVAKARLVGD